LDDIEIGKDERGCLFIQAVYLSNEKIATNDLVEIISEKKFRWLGRWDNIINSGGIKISPEKVELAVAEVFASLGLSNQFFIAGLPDDVLSQKVTLVVEGMSFHEDIKTKILIELKSKVGQYELPKEIKFARNFELTETGKIRRAETLNLIPASSH
jgi:O-succinylbenzoic acid--CoA ligase